MNMAFESNVTMAWGCARSRSTSAIGNSAARIARLAHEVKQMGGRRRRVQRETHVDGWTR
jgi:hypothetical protein